MKISPAAVLAALLGNKEDFIAATTPGGIEAQEARGQKDFVTAETLPINCPKKELEDFGFVFGTAVDDLFIQASFPKGWKKKATNHSMWSDLIDESGRKRASIFYKAAFYDRHAYLYLEK